MKKKFRTLVVLCLAVLMALSVSLTGCQKSGGGSSSSAKASGFVIGFSNFGVGNSWRVQMEAEFKSEADKLKSDGTISNYYMTDSNGDISKQISDVKDLITKKVDAIIITAASPSALSPVCEQAVSQGIKVVAFDNIVTTDKITSKVDIDEVEFGRVNAQFLVDKLGGKGNIVVLNGQAGTACNQLRWQGGKEVFDKNTGIKILGDANADWDYAKGKSAVENFLSAYPTINGVWSQGGAMTQAALDAFVEANRPLVPMSGEANNGLLKEWKKYESQGFDSVAPCMPTYISASALDVAVDALKGKTVEKSNIIKLPVITSDNLDQYVREDLPDSFWNITKLSDAQIKALFTK